VAERDENSPHVERGEKDNHSTFRTPEKQFNVKRGGSSNNPWIEGKKKWSFWGEGERIFHRKKKKEVPWKEGGKNDARRRTGGKRAQTFRKANPVRRSTTLGDNRRLLWKELPLPEGRKLANGKNKAARPNTKGKVSPKE